MNAALHLPANPYLGHLVQLSLIQLLPDCLHFLPEFLAILLAADIHKGCEVGQADGLTSIGVGSHLGNDLRGDVTGGGEAVGLLDQCIRNHRAVLQHVLQVHQLTVGDGAGYIAHIVDMDNAFVMGEDHVLREDISAADILGYLGCQIVAHGGIQHRVLVRVLLFRQLVIVTQQGQYLCIRAALFAQQFMAQPVVAVLPGQFVMFALIQFIHDHVLDFFDTNSPAKSIAAFLHIANNKTDHRIRQPVFLCDTSVGGFYRIFDFRIVERYLRTISLDYLHELSSSSSFPASASNSSQLLPRYVLHCSSRRSNTLACSSAVKSMKYLDSLSSESALTT